MPPAAKKAAPAKAAPKPAEPVEELEPVDGDPEAEAAEDQADEAAEDETPAFCPDPGTCFPHGIQPGHHRAHCIHGEWNLATE